MKVGIVDYKLGNIFSLQQACLRIGFDPLVSDQAVVLSTCDALILPGVGAFRDAIENLSSLNLKQFLLNFAQSNKPLIGICLGMQILFSEGEEFGFTSGLNLISGKVIKFPDVNPEGPYVIPQMGWNKVQLKDSDSFQMKENEMYMYFAHSFHAQDVPDEHIIGTTNYAGKTYPSIVKKNNIIGFQFHPEKSAETGLKLLKNALINNYSETK